MNWLAHVLLSEPDIEFRLGNLLADIVKGEARAAMSERFMQGVRRHQLIDSFTDAHPVVRRSRARMSAGQRRFSGVLVDVFYDHLLSIEWPRYCATPLGQFTSDFYAAALAADLQLPQQARITVERIARYDLLSQYVRVEGVENSLRRLSQRLARRWNRPFALERGTAELLQQHEQFTADFAEFFPQLQQFAAAQATA